VVCADVARCGSGMSGMWAWLSWQLHDNGEAIISLLACLRELKAWKKNFDIQIYSNQVELASRRRKPDPKIWKDSIKEDCKEMHRKLYIFLRDVTVQRILEEVCGIAADACWLGVARVFSQVKTQVAVATAGIFQRKQMWAWQWKMLSSRLGLDL